jgi:hypothetical protein
VLGFLFGKKAIDEYRAEVLHTYLQTYHRTFERIGLDRLLGTIKSNALVERFADIGDYKSFGIKTDIGDFNFIIPTPKGVEGKPIVTVHGAGPYQGFSVLIRLDDGGLLLFMKDSTARAMKLCEIFQTKYGAGRVS